MGCRAALFVAALVGALVLAAPGGASSSTAIALKVLRHQQRHHQHHAPPRPAVLYHGFVRLDVHLAAVVRRSAAPAATTPSAAPAAKQSVVLSADESSILDKINAVRAKYGVRPLTVSAGLTAAARQHSLEMVKRGYFAHESADGTPFDKRIRRYYRFRSAGENIAYGCPDLSPSEAMELWLNSPPHRRNILYSGFREIGISLVHVDSAQGPDYEGDPTTVVTTDFGSR